MKKTFLLLIVIGALHDNGFAQWGGLDNTFGSSGKLTTDFGSNDVAITIAMQADGKIVAAGYTADGSDFSAALARYKIDGSLDSSFGINGKVITVGPNGYSLSSIAIQPDGKIVAGGSAYLSYYYLIIRYNNDGSLDSTFGENGVVTQPTDGGISSIALQEDGRIVVVGTVEYLIFPKSSGMFLFTYNSDGTLDSTFLGGFIDFEPYDAWAYDVAIQSDKKIVVAGFSDSGAFLIRYFTLVRVDSNGLLDSSFGINGKAVTALGSSSQGYSLTIQPDGKMVVAGNSYNDLDEKTYLVRYNSNGTVDSTFGTNGIVAGSNYYFSDVTKQPDGKIVVAGDYSYNGMNDFAVLRYNTDGSPDNSFGLSGKTTTNFGSNSESALAVAMQADGKIVLAGYSNNDFALARYLSGLVVGVLDLTVKDPVAFIYPNPICSEATLEYALTKEECISISLFNLQGDKVESFITNESKTPGEHQQQLIFDQSLPCGNYILSISNGIHSQSIKIIIAK